MRIVHRQQSLAPPPGQIVDQNLVIVSQGGLRGDEVVESRSGEVVIGQPRRGDVHAGIGVGVGRNGGGVRTVRRKVDKERTASARGPRHVVPLDPLRRLVRNRVGGVVGLVSDELKVGRFVILVGASVATDSSLEPSIEPHQRVEVGLAEHSNLVTFMGSQMHPKRICFVERGVDVPRRRGLQLLRRDRQIGLDVVEIAAGDGLAPRRRADWRVNPPLREQGSVWVVLKQLLGLRHRLPPSQLDVLVVGEREDDVGTVLAGGTGRWRRHPSTSLSSAATWCGLWDTAAARNALPVRQILHVLEQVALV
eukprot:m.59677 g.59677  ORF g.59677 m.59677 type:complete len:308 (-) comp9473_c0_seq1:263-1186(-)